MSNKLTLLLTIAALFSGAAVGWSGKSRNDWPPYSRLEGPGEVVYELRLGLPGRPVPIQLWKLSDSDQEEQLLVEFEDSHVAHSPYDLVDVKFQDDELAVLMRFDFNIRRAEDDGGSVYRRGGNTWGANYTYIYLLASSDPERTLARRGYKLSPLRRHRQTPYAQVSEMWLTPNMRAEPREGSDQYGTNPWYAEMLQTAIVPYSVTLETSRVVEMRIGEGEEAEVIRYENDIVGYFRNDERNDLSRHGWPEGILSHPLSWYKDEEVERLVEMIRSARWEDDPSFARYLREDMIESLSGVDHQVKLLDPEQGMNDFSEFLGTVIEDESELAALMGNVRVALEFHEEYTARLNEEARIRRNEYHARQREEALERQRMAKERAEADRLIRERRREERRIEIERRRQQREAERAE